jgi:hypothetical protein
MKKKALSVLSQLSGKLLFSLFLSLFLTIHSCSEQPALECPEGLEPFHQVTLYFGLSSPDGTISASDWQSYLEDVVTPHFPEGFTVFDSHGQWKDPEGVIIKEPGKVITHYYTIDDNKSEPINAVIEGFKERHQAQSVIREKNVICLSF